MATILIVDDIEGVHEMMDMVFMDTGFEIRHALSGLGAVEIYKNEPVDVVVSDIQMPGLNGLELFEELQALDPYVVCIMMTAANSKEYVIKALRLGAFDYVEKPFDEDAFVQMVSRGAEERRRRHIAQKQSGGAAVAFLPAAADKRDEEIARLKAELENKQDSPVNQEEIERLKQQLHERDLKLQAQEAKEQELLQRQNELELKQSALETMDSVMKERLNNLQRIEKGNHGEQLSPEARKELQQLKAELEAKENELKESELNIQERELFLQTSEESLFEKGQRLTEMEAELEQLREELENRRSSAKDAGGNISAEDQVELDKLKDALDAKQSEIEKQEKDLVRRELAVRKAEMLVKAREEFLQQSESILFGSKDNQE